MAGPSLSNPASWSPAAWTWAVVAAVAALLFLLVAGLHWILVLAFAVLAFAAVVWIFHGDVPTFQAADPAAAPSATAPLAGAASSPHPQGAPATPEPVANVDVSPAEAATESLAVPDVAVDASPGGVSPQVPTTAPTGSPGVQSAVGAMPEVDMEAAQAASSARVRSAAQAAGELARLAGEPVAAVRPAGLEGPRNDRGDDLKKIRGVGQKLEAMLQNLGFWHFDQIAAWTPAELAWVDAHLDAFNGRAGREDWVGQAKLLAAGGETEHSRAVERGEFGGDTRHIDRTRGWRGCCRAHAALHSDRARASSSARWASATLRSNTSISSCRWP